MSAALHLVMVLLSTTDPATPSGSATVPLQELVPLLATQGSRPPDAPPIDALVTGARLQGRLSGTAVDLDAHFDVEVLAGERWTRVDLLTLGPGAFVSESPTVQGATVGVWEGRLCLVTRTAGRYSFDVALTLPSAGAGPVRTVRVDLPPDVPPAPLRIEADPSVFELLEAASSGASGAREVSPRKGVLTVSWKTVAARPALAPVVRAPLEPSIPKATASWVSTLEGRATLRVRYELRLDRPQTLELELPPDNRLERVLVNQSPVEAVAADGKVQVKVAPERLGDTEGTVELVLSRDLGVFHLSGSLELVLPRASWPIAEVNAVAHLPEVFNYRREGGSLEEISSSEPEAGADRSLPGRVLRFRQFLVAASAPSVELKYSVDISQSYFR